MLDFAFFYHFLNGLLMVGLPVALAVYLTRHFHTGWRLVWIGAATFLLSQAGHIPFTALLTRLFQVGILPKPPAAWIPYFNPVVLGLSAGLFEELSRAAVYAWWAKDARSWRKGVLFGAGHGGIEAVILGGLALYSFLQMVALRGADLSRLVPASQLSLAQQQVSAYWSAPWYASLLGAVERSLTIPFHISLAVIVLQAFTRRQPAWVGLAVLLHALVDGLAVYLAAIWNGLPWGVYAIEGMVGAFTLVGLAFLIALYRSEPQATPEASPSPPPPLRADQLQPVAPDHSLTADSLDKSKYDRS